MPGTATVTTVPAIFMDTVFADKFDGTIYKAIKCNPKNIKSLGMDGKTWNVPWNRTRDATAAEKEQFNASAAAQASADPFADLFRAGNVVKFKAPNKPAAQGIFVVTKEKAEGYSLSRLGGDAQRRYFPTVPGNLLEKVDGLQEITNI